MTLLEVVPWDALTTLGELLLVYLAAVNGLSAASGNATFERAPLASIFIAVWVVVFL